MMPRIAALSELRWNNPKQKNLDISWGHLAGLDLCVLYGYHYKQDIDNVTMISMPVKRTALVTLSTPSTMLRYSTHRWQRTDSFLYGTFPYRKPSIKAKAIRNGRESETTEETLNYSLTTMRPITAKLSGGLPSRELRC